MPDTKRTATGVLGGLAGLVGLSAAAGVLIAATVTPAVALTSTAAERAITMFDNLPSVLELDKLMLPSNFYYTNPDTGQPELMTKFLEQDRTPVEFDQIAPVMYDALLSSEDPRYYQHGGIDLIGTARALLSNAKGGAETQGASSISQQYVKNVLIQKCEQGAKTEYEVDKDGNPVFNDDGTQKVKVSREQALLDCWTDATTAQGAEGYTRKLQEMRYAISLEQKYSKNDILKGYMNIANWGGVTYGVESAARQYFGTTAANLTVAQAATLAGMVQNPNNYRIDKPGGSIFSSDGTSFNKAPDGVIDEGANLVALDNLVKSGEITEEQKFAAADGYTSTKVRQLYVLSRMLDDGKITREQYVEAAVWPITPNVVEAQTGCVKAVGKEYFCQYVKDVILNDPAFGDTEDARRELLQRGGLNVYTTLDPRIQATAQDTMANNAPANPSLPPTKEYPNGGRFGSATVSVEATTGRILSITQNTKFSEESANATNLEYSSLVFAGDQQFGSSGGFAAGSTFKLFTLVDWLEKGHSVNETLNGTLHVFKRLKDSCNGDWVNQSNDLIKNFANNKGYMGNPMRFTKESLNTGFFAMAEKLDLCDIKNVATRMGVTRGDGTEVRMNGLGSIIGSNEVSPLAMAGAYATVANNGVYCQPQAIDRITDSEGNDIKKPERTCTQVIAPNIAATAAYALKGVLQGGGSGSGANPGDGTVTIGKTGTNEATQTWMIQSNTRVTTATWAGNTYGGGDLFKAGLNNIRFAMSKAIQRTVDQTYPGGAFPEPDNALTKVTMVQLPNVLGMTMDAAKAQLEEAGFTVEIGPEVDSNQPAGSVGAQNPGAGEVAGGTTVTINPSNGAGISIPDVSGRSLDDAKRALRQAGFGNVSDGTCTPTNDGSKDTKAKGTNPAAGTVVNRNASITVDYTASDCGGGGGRTNGPGNG
ncbi:MAG: PASTA domain-containing protein [Terrabacter sp.]|nr:PASTA domain-containing protein [Terrabacter sp.]